MISMLHGASILVICTLLAGCSSPGKDAERPGVDDSHTLVTQSALVDVLAPFGSFAVVHTSVPPSYGTTRTIQFTSVRGERVVTTTYSLDEPVYDVALSGDDRIYVATKTVLTAQLGSSDRLENIPISDAFSPLKFSPSCKMVYGEWGSNGYRERAVLLLEGKSELEILPRLGPAEVLWRDVVWAPDYEAILYPTGEMGSGGPTVCQRIPDGKECLLSQQLDEFLRRKGAIVKLATEYELFAWVPSESSLYAVPWTGLSGMWKVKVDGLAHELRVSTRGDVLVAVLSAEAVRQLEFKARADEIYQLVPGEPRLERLWQRGDGAYIESFAFASP